MKKAMTMITLVASLTATAYAQENKSEEKSREMSVLYTGGLGMAGAGSAVASSALLNNGRTLSVNEITDRLRTAGPNEVFTIEYQDSRQSQQLKAIIKYQGLIAKTDQRIRELRRWVIDTRGAKDPAVEKAALRELNQLDTARSQYRTALEDAQKGILKRVDMPTHSVTYNRNQLSQVRALLQNKNLTVSSVKVTRATSLSSRLLSRRFVGGAAGIAAGGAIAVYETTRMNKVADVNERETEIATEEYRTQTRPATLIRSAAE